ncbi:hypothetical protein [Sorangium atrum]|uniref:Secreted protein n=1 Tax=Sorangium atrum TaxID=2995308 RepID=A0ABT5C4W2_9BACT|nr:hypothetical protein [Sorangium aterium]MDC0681459.1 hypothetical protein [Sorangium aterium]
MRYNLFVGLLALPLLGCGSDPADADDAGATTTGATTSTGSAGTGGGAGGESPGCAPTAAPDVTDVSGTWAYRAIGSQLTQAQGLPPFQTRIVSVMLITQQQNGDAISLQGTYCDHYTEDPDAIVHAVIPDSFRGALAPVTREGTFAAGEGGLRYELGPLHEVIGAALDDPTQDELPTDPADARVVDQDEDGHPGMTVQLQGLIDGSVYVAERARTELDGVAVATDRIEGRLGFVSEQSVLETDPASLKATMAASRTYPDPEECNSTFVMVRTPDDADCAWIKERADTLFQ